MKKIVIIDCGPRLNMNTAMLLQRFAEGAKSVGSDVEVKTIRLYDLDFKGCMSCMVCKLKEIGKMVGVQIPLTMYVARHSWVKCSEG